LLPSVAEGFARCLGIDDRQPFDVLERAIAMLEALDPAGDGFRYATTRIGESSMIEKVYLDPRALLQLIHEVSRCTRRGQTVKAVIIIPETRTLLFGCVGIASQDRECSHGLHHAPPPR
jgi:hypothetical protein